MKALAAIGADSHSGTESECQTARECQTILGPITRIMPAGPYEGQVPVGEYEKDRAHKARMQLIEMTVTGRRYKYVEGGCLT